MFLIQPTSIRSTKSNTFSGNLKIDTLSTRADIQRGLTGDPAERFDMKKKRIIIGEGKWVIDQVVCNFTVRGDSGMSIITISRGTYTGGKEIAEKLASRLGYKCISREVLLEASTQFNIPEVKLIRALHDSPSVLSRFTHGKAKYVAFIRKALLESVRGGNVIYHGLAGQFLLQEVPHVFRVRIVADLEDRIREEMRREEISEEKARYVLKKDDDERRKWSLSLYGIDTADISLYDMVIHIGKLTIDDAVDILADTAVLPQFRPTDESAKILSDLVVAARAHAKLLDQSPTVKVDCKDGCVFVNIAGPPTHQEQIAAQVNGLLKSVDGVKEIKTTITPSLSDH
jgi:cytidylate kinase